MVQWSQFSPVVSIPGIAVLALLIQQALLPSCPSLWFTNWIANGLNNPWGESMGLLPVGSLPWVHGLVGSNRFTLEVESREFWYIHQLFHGSLCPRHEKTTAIFIFSYFEDDNPSTASICFNHVFYVISYCATWNGGFTVLSHYPPKTLRGLLIHTCYAPT